MSRSPLLPAFAESVVVTALAVLAAGIPRRAAAQDAPTSFTVDQRNDRPAPQQGFVLPAAAPVGQSFVPALGHLNVVELQMNSQTSAAGGVAVVRIRSGSITGAVLGESNPAAVPAVILPVDLVHFDFATPVALDPVADYIEVVATRGALGVFATPIAEDSPRGTAVAFGKPQPNLDLWFREGISYPPGADRSNWGSAPRREDP